MNSLYRESPVVDRSAVTNSKYPSQLDLTVLDRSQVCTIAHRQVRVDIAHRLLTMMGRPLTGIELMYSLCVQALLYLPTPTHPNAPRLCLHLASSCVEVYLYRIHHVKCSLGLQSMLFVLRPAGKPRAGAEYPPMNPYLLSGYGFCWVRVGVPALVPQGLPVCLPKLACNFSNDTSKERVVDLVCCLLPLSPSKHSTEWIQTQPSDENRFHMIIFKLLIKVETSFQPFSTVFRNETRI
jgi:hypothetical protein